MRRWLSILLLALPTVLSAQLVSTPRLWIEPSALAKLNSTWTDSAGQNERAYCVRYITRRRKKPLLPEYTVVDVWPAIVIGAAPMSLDAYECPNVKDSDEVTILHTHPPHTDLDDLYPDPNRKTKIFIGGGYEARQCWPSDQDYTSMMYRTNHPFELVMCAKDGIGVFFRRPFIIIP